MKTITLTALLLIGITGFAQQPKFKQGDTVYNYHNKNYYIIDSLQNRKHKKQIFYACHDLNRQVWYWLPENSIKKSR